MTVTYRDGVAILQLVSFVPCLVLAVMLNIRHGFSRSAGWLFLIILSLMRIIGAICWLITISSPSVGAITGAAVCASIGLLPLTLLCLGLLHRVNNFTTTRPIPALIFKGIVLFGFVGLILGIVGGSMGRQSRDPPSASPETQAAIVIYVIIFVAVCVIFGIFILRMSQIEHGERRILLAIGISGPLILSRLIYSMIFDFGHYVNFDAIFGNVTIYLCMAVIEEIIVVVVFIATGFTLKVVPKQPANAPNDEMADAEAALQGSSPNKNTAAYQTRTVPRHTMRKRGPITWLIGTAQEYYYSRKDREIS